MKIFKGDECLVCGSEFRFMLSLLTPLDPKQEFQSIHMVLM